MGLSSPPSFSLKGEGFERERRQREEEEIVIDPLAFRNENITMSTTAIEALMIEKSNLAHEDLSEELIANFSHSWKMSNLSSSSNLIASN